MTAAGSTLVVCFDGLRRDRADAERMPTLASFLRDGADIANSRSVFPSETRVAVSSFVTGCAPSSHGIVANSFFHRAAIPDALFRTGRREDLERADAAGLMLDRPALGERLAEAGRRYAVVSTASPGATYLLSHRAETLGQPVFSVHPGCGTAGIMREAGERFGATPPAGTPNTARLRHARRVLTDLVYPTTAPDIAVLWLSDPDSTGHRFGIDAPETVTAQRGCDEVFAEILDWWRRGDGPENVVAMSDHGQITGTGVVDLPATLPDWSAMLSPGAFSGVHFPDASSDGIAAAIDRLATTSFCGLILTSLPGRPDEAVPGTLPLSLLGNAHLRSAALGFTLRTRAGSAAEECLLPGDVVPLGGGMHGGLTHGEMTTVLAAQGPAFARRRRVETPAWIPDIAPTLLAVLGLDPEGMDGRPIVEALAAPAVTLPAIERRTLRSEFGRHRQVVEQWLVDGRPIADRAWSEPEGDAFA